MEKISIFVLVFIFSCASSVTADSPTIVDSEVDSGDSIIEPLISQPLCPSPIYVTTSNGDEVLMTFPCFPASPVLPGASDPPGRENGDDPANAICNQTINPIPRTQPGDPRPK